MNNKLKTITRIISLISAIGLAVVIFLPMWRIDLLAPQYPEGLYLQIYPNKLGGDVDIINGLNHYIGMKHIAEKDFVEFKILPFLIAGLAIFGLLTAIINRKWFFYTWFIFFLAFGIVAMADFYIWLYNYGHNLDPSAAIKVPGQSYQPPLIGYKQLLNFGAYSFPDSGGWIFIGVGVALLVCMWLEIRHNLKKTPPRAFTAILLPAILSLLSCQDGPKDIPFGKVACDQCRMTIMDKKFGTELVTTKGKIFYFDDLICLKTFRETNTTEDVTKGTIYLSDFSGNGKLILASEAFYATGDGIRGPMGGNVAAFSTTGERDKMIASINGTVTEWKNIMP